MHAAPLPSAPNTSLACRPQTRLLQYLAQGVSKELGRSSELLAHTLRRGEPEVSSKELARSKKLGASKVLRKSGEEGLSCAF
jgi:hypothetical protein